MSARVPLRTARRLPHAFDCLCREQIARFRRPNKYRFVAALPENIHGKVLKTELRCRLQS